jgi:hypothetical protein
MRFLIPALNAHLKRIAIAGRRRHVRNALTCGLVALGIAAPVSAQQVVDWADFSSPTSAAYPGGGNVTVTIASSYRRDGSSVTYSYMAGYPQVDAAPVEELAALEATAPFQTQFPYGSIGPRSAMATWNTSTNVGTIEHVLTMDFPAANRAGGDTLVGLGGVYPNISGPKGSRLNSRWIVTATRCNGTAETNYSGWSSIIPPTGFTATDGAAGAVFSTPVTGAATSGGYVVSVGTLSTYNGNRDAVPALVRPAAGTCYSRITITRAITSSGTELPGGWSPVDTEYFKLYIGKVLDAGILRLRKSLPHGRAVSGNQFHLRIAGGTGADVVATTSGTTNTPTQVATLEPALAGTAYTLSEAAAGSPATVLSNYRTTYACTNTRTGGQTPSGSGTSFTVTPAANDDLTCTFTNSRIATLRLRKELPNGRSVAGDQFRLSIAGTDAPAAVTTTGTGSAATGTVTHTTATAGSTYTLSETAASGAVLGNYATTYSCTNARSGGQTPSGSDTTFEVTPVAGDDLTCTFSNALRPRVTIRKTSIGGTGSFTFSGNNGIANQTIATATSGTPVAGAVQMLTTVGQATTITEDALPAGFALTDIACTGVPAGSTTVNLATRTVTLSAAATAAGTNATCTFTNTRPTQLTLRKTVTNDNGGTQPATAWTLSAAGPTAISGATGAAAVTNATVNPGTYTLTESATPTGYTASSYSCVKNGGAAVSGNSITLAAGDTATCTINNDDRPATLTLRKTVTNDNGGTQLPTAWTLSAAGPTAISGATGSAAVTNATVNPGTYTLSESATPTGYTASSYSCVKNGGAAVVGNNITLAAGDAATCTINNNDSDQTDVSITKVASADTVVRGDEVVFTLVVRNPGVAAAPGTVVRDPAMAGLDCTAAGLAVPTCSATGGASCPTPLTASGLQAGVAIPALPAGSTVSIDLTCRATASGMP